MGMGATNGTSAVASGRRRRRRRGVMSEINVTPMVDVMLVLLIIFMVSAPLLTVGVPIDLPQSQAKSLDQDKEPLTLSLNGDGKIFLQNTEIGVEELVHGGDAVVELVQHRVHVPFEHRTGLGQPQSAAVAPQQRRAHLRLQPGQRPRYPGLGDRLQLADLRDRGPVGDLLEPPQRIRIHTHDRRSWVASFLFRNENQCVNWGRIMWVVRTAKQGRQE